MLESFIITIMVHSLNGSVLLYHFLIFSLRPIKNVCFKNLDALGLFLLGM